jgi:NAD+ synthase
MVKFAPEVGMLKEHEIQLELECKKVLPLLARFIYEETNKIGLGRVVVGLSGGIDSALSTYLATEALGPENVVVILMPYKSSHPSSLTDAMLVVEDLGVKHYRFDITPQIDAYFKHFPDASANRRGNKMARERMTILYDISALEGALVLGTSNKSELLLGYSTLWGDMASALNPLGDLYKTHVYELSRHLKIPEVISGKQPSADLWEGQTDEGELGFTYYDVDKLLYALIDLRYTPEEAIASGFDEAFVERVYEMIRRSQFKRMTPLICKISHRTLGTDFRYLRDWGS